MNPLKLISAVGVRWNQSTDKYLILLVLVISAIFLDDAELRSALLKILLSGN